ncbi:hypothetical protein [Allopontixanthobacter sp.]|nr:hypothetical protein [Allopontixanthobacter sp.]MDZ4306504.1 hypothetical protein [Allopontixanthobacter sp.]
MIVYLTRLHDTRLSRYLLASFDAVVVDFGSFRTVFRGRTSQ